MQQPTPAKHLGLSLFSLRLGIFVVMFFWTLDKFINPGHAAKVFAGFYGVENAGETFLAIIASIQMAVVLAFLAGALKTWTYGLVLLMHTVSTLSSWRQYMEPFDNLLFFAAWPMLAACLALFLLREQDQLFNMDAWLKSRRT